MYPQTMIQIIDESSLNKVTVANNADPVFMQAFTADKGPEEFGRWSGNNFFKTFGYTQDFNKHGQALKQAAEIIKAGGELYCRRFCAPDAKLANIGVYVRIITVESKMLKKDDNGDPVTDGSGNPVYLKLNTTTGEYEATSDATEAATEKTVTLKYGSVVVDTTSNDMENLASKFEAACPASSTNNLVIPLFVIAAAGRGESDLRVRITPNYRYSRSYGYAKYSFEIIEGTETLESMYFAMNPNNVENEQNNSLEMVLYSTSNEVRCVQFEENIEDMYHTIESILGYTKDELENVDFLFGCDIKGNSIDKISVDTTDFNLQALYGNALQGGDNGSFGDAPLKSSDYESELIKCFNGEYDEEIYNLDSAQIDLILDANYPESVKRAIENFVTFREDCFFIRDMGTDVSSIEEFELKEFDVLHNRYSSSYCNHMITTDPQTKKKIRITLPYLLAEKLVVHFINGRTRPFAGLQYGIYFTYGKGYGYQVQKGSVNFIPKVTPSVDEKQKLEDLGINYCSVYNGNQLSVETLYTAQHVDTQTQLSFSCNVIAIQQVIKALRARCPKSRYSFIDQSGLEAYQKDINTELAKYSSNFAEFTLEYQYDADYEANKIYYATISVRFKDFVQAEYFKIIALPTV